MWRSCLFYSFSARALCLVVKGLGYEVAYWPLSSLSPPAPPLPPHDTTAPSGPGLPHYQGITIILRHTTLVTTLLDEWPALHSDLYLTTQHSESDIHVPGRSQTCSHWNQPPLSSTEVRNERSYAPPLSIWLNGMHRGNFICTCTCLFVCWLQSLVVRV
jgi:hypothetical protein